MAGQYITAQSDSLHDTSGVLPWHQAAGFAVAPKTDSLAGSGKGQSTKIPARRFITQNRSSAMEINPRPLAKPQQDFEVMFGALAFAILIFGYIRLSSHKFFGNLQQVIFSRALFKQNLRDGTMLTYGTAGLLTLADITVFAAFGYQLAGRYDIRLPGAGQSPFRQLLFLAGMILVFILLKNMLISVAGFIFKTKTLAREFRANLFVFNTVAALFLIPLLIFMMIETAHMSHLISLSVLGLLFIFRFIRAFLIAMDVEKYAWYQNFLYLCALEILPILVIVKSIMVAIVE